MKYGTKWHASWRVVHLGSFLQTRLILLFTGLFLWPSLGQSQANAKRSIRPMHDNSTATKAGELKPGQGSRLFPDWPTTEFDWFVAPIIGVKFASTEVDGKAKRSDTTIEGGLAAGLIGIPVPAGNPGAALAPDVGAAYGYNHSSTKRVDGHELATDSHYRRHWLGTAATFYAHYFRYRLNVRLGELAALEAPHTTIHSLGVGNDFGVLILPWVSQHYTVNYLRGYLNNDKKFLEDFDHWLHTRLFFTFMSTVCDFGPGFTQTWEYNSESGKPLAAGHSNYLLVRAGFNPVWKLVADGQFKYIYDSDDSRLGLYAGMRLPEDELSTPNTLSMPEDSFMGSLFLGVKDIVFGIGAGWRTNIQVLNVNRHHGADNTTTRDQGFGLYYELRF